MKLLINSEAAYKNKFFIINIKLYRFYNYFKYSFNRNEYEFIKKNFDLNSN